MSNDKRMSTNCCIVGGGPAGVMAGFLLARRGVEVLVLEKHQDFFRDFRGDTVHPSTLNIFDQLGILDKFLELPHQKVDKFNLEINNNSQKITMGDFSKLNIKSPYIAMVPQWDFLNFIVEHAKKYLTLK